MADRILRILVSRLRFIGDIVLTTPVIEVLRERFPDCVIDYLGDGNAVALLQNNPNLDEIISYDFSAFEVGEQLRIASVLRKKRYDIAIDLFGNPRSAIAIFLSGAKMRIGGDFGWRGRLFTHPVTISERMTAVSFHLKYLAPLGIREDYRRPRIFLREDEVHEAGEYLARSGVGGSRPLVGMHIGATWPAKVWPPQDFARLGESIVEELGGELLITYGRKDIKYLEAFSSSINVGFIPIEPQNLRRLAAIISRCNIYVSNDAAPMHISAAVGTSTIGIFGPGEPDVWFPYERSLGHRALHKDVQCCHRDFCQLKGEEYLRCMKSITHEEVFETVRDILKMDKKGRR